MRLYLSILVQNFLENSSSFEDLKGKDESAIVSDPAVTDFRPMCPSHKIFTLSTKNNN